MRIKKYNRKSYLILGVGIIVFLIGILNYFFSSANATINLRTQLPTVSDGSLILIIGLGVILGGVYRLVYAEKILRKNDEWDKKEKKRKDKKYRLTGKSD